MKLRLTNSNLPEIISSHPEIIQILRKKLIIRIMYGTIFLLLAIGLFLIFSFSIIVIALLGIAIFLFYRSYKYYIVYSDANRIYWEQNLSIKDTISKSSMSDRKTAESSYVEYAQIYRHPLTDNNLNYDRYVFSAKFISTGRIRTKKHIDIFAGQNVIEEIKKLGYTEPIEYQIETCSASEKQIEYLRDLTNNSVPNALSLEDASALITRLTTYDHIPNPQLFEYATQKHIRVSYYTGKKALYDIIFNSLNEVDKIAFFVFCVYRYLSKDFTTANLNKSKHKLIFYEFAESVKNDSSFLESLNKYSGSSLRFFGTRTVNGCKSEGGSKNTIAYKKAKKFLEEKNILVQ